MREIRFEGHTVYTNFIAAWRHAEQLTREGKTVKIVPVSGGWSLKVS